MTDEEKPRSFDAVRFLEASGSLLREYYKSPRRRNLDFKTQCAVYACLYDNRLSQAVVCRVFDISRSTVSYIAGCRDDNRQATIMEVENHSETIGVDGYLTKNRNEDRRPRYQAVADEFDRLGPDEFVKTYLTKQIARRIVEVRNLLTGKIYLDGVKKTVDGDER